jgi:hypothetical protein
MSHFLRLYANLVTVLFLLGVAGCAIVLLMTIWEDMMTIMGVEERRKKPSSRILPSPVSRTSSAQ